MEEKKGEMSGGKGREWMRFGIRILTVGRLLETSIN
jgi:hypothetical protein